MEEKKKKINKFIEYMKDFKQFFMKNIFRIFIIILFINIVFILGTTVININKEKIILEKNENKEQEAIEENKEQKDEDVKPEEKNEIDNSKIDKVMTMPKYIAENALSLLIVVLAGFIPFIFLGVLGVFVIMNNTTSLILSMIFYSTLTNRRGTGSRKYYINNNINYI